MREKSSFRDPSGFVFYKDSKIYRAINHTYKNNYDLLLDSGLYNALVNNNWLVKHTEVSSNSEIYKTIQPEEISFISYPYEWTFNQLKSAAVLTLDIQILALKYGMSLKDASAYNVQFSNGQPIFIDTLSFEKYNDNSPWIAFGQFTKQFLGPLVLMKYVSNSLGVLSKNFIDGIPVNLVSKLLPLRSYFNINVLMSIHLQAKYVKDAELISSTVKKTILSKKRQEGMLLQIRDFIYNLKPNKDSVWIDYYDTNTYLEKEDAQKKDVVKKAIQSLNPKTVWDLGSNTGAYSIIASENNAEVIAFDSDHDSVSRLYNYAFKQKKNILPLIMDFSNPSSSLGWAESERKSLSGRGPADMTLALALIHHLRISFGIPFEEIELWLNEITQRWLVIEYIPKEDSQVKKLLLNREDVFSDFSKETFEKEFSKNFNLISKHDITSTGRMIYVFEKIYK